MKAARYLTCRPDGTVHTVWGWLSDAVLACIRNDTGGWFVKSEKTGRVLWRVT